MATYIVCAGAFAGGWYMRKLATNLRAAGHEVFTPTFTGLGERVHLLTREIDLDTHIQDIVNVLEYEDLYDVILVGKSYSGMTITGVAERTPERLRHLVFVDAVVPQNGQSLVDLLAPEVRTFFLQVIDDHGEGWRLPADRSEEPRLTDQPSKTFTQAVAVQNPTAATLNRTYIRCTAKPPDFPIRVALDQCAERARAAGWQYRELPTGHEPERDAPDALCKLLLEVDMKADAG